MTRRRLALLAAVVTVVALPIVCQDSPKADECFGSAPAQCELKAGVRSYKNARYEHAIAHFRRAVTLNSNLVPAHLYLASALAQQFIPGVETPENTQFAEQAITEYSTVIQLTKQPGNERLVATRGIASLYLQMKKFGDAKDYYRKAIEIDLNDPESYYSIAVIDWTESYTARMNAYQRLNIKPQERRWDIGTCQNTANDHLAEVEEGMQMLVKALELRPNYDDAMAYMNLLYRERADLQCNDVAAHDADLAKADSWVDATLAAKKAKVEQAQRSQPVAH